MAKVLGDEVASKWPFLPGMRPVTSDPLELELNNAVIVAHYRYGRYNDFRRVFERVRNSWPAFFAAVSAAAASRDPLAAVEALAREP